MRFRLFTQIFLVFALVMIVCVGVSGWFVMQFSGNIVTRKICDGDRNFAGRIAQEIEAEVASVKPTLTLLAQTPELRLMEATKVSVGVDRVRRAFQEITSIYVADLEGNQIYRTGTGPLKNVSNMRSFQSAKGGDKFSSNIYLKPTTLEPMQTVTLPIIDSGTVVGVLSADVSFGRIMRSFMGVSVGEDGNVIVVANDGRVIAHTHIEQVQGVDLSSLPVVKAVLAGEAGTMKGYTDELGREVLGTYMPISELGWGVLIQRPLANMYAEVNQLRTAIIWVVIASVLLVLPAGWLMSREIARPIGQIASASKRVAQGDLSTPVDVKSSNEVGLLAHSFNQMVMSLKRARDELQQWGEDLEQSRNALKESEERFRQFFENEPAYCYIVSPEGVILDVNKAALDILGYQKGQLVGKPLESVYAPESLPRMGQLLPRWRETGVLKDEEMVIITKEGNRRTVLLSADAIRDKDGNVLNSLSVQRDITERKQAEEALRRSEGAAKQLSEENSIMAEIGRIISSTLNIEEVYGRFVEEALKLIPFDRISINIINTKAQSFTVAYLAGMEVPYRRQGEVAPLAGTVTAQAAHKRGGLIIQTEDKGKITAHIPGLLKLFIAGMRSFMAVPLISRDEVIGALHFQSIKVNAYAEKELRLAERIGNQIAGAIANAQLFAERMRAEEAKTALEEQLRQSQKMEAIGQLAGGIAHDFNNLLTIITGYSQLSLQELRENDPLKENIEEIQKASERASNLTRQILAFSRRQVMEMKVLDLNTLLRDLEKMLYRVIGEDIELVTFLAEDLGRVKTDPGQIEQVIMNLAVNARDSMPSGGKLMIETANVALDGVCARNHVAVPPGRYVMLSMSDTGVGMTPEVRERVFEPFFSTKEKGKGTGLGLSTVYGIVKQSGGNIWVYSEPGKGATFKVYLPRVDEPLAADWEKMAGEGLPGGSETILVVEDGEEVRKLAVRILRQQGYKVLEASKGLDGFLICEEHKGPIHLLLTDVVMPKMSGWELADRIVSIRPEIKVLYMSGYTDNAIAHHGVLEKGVNYIQKPFTVEGLAKKVRRVLDKDSKPAV